MLNVYSVQFNGYWPVGACGIVLARDRGHARRLFMQELEKIKLAEKNADLKSSDFKLLTFETGVHILNDGNY